MAFGGVMSALAVVILYLASVLPTLKLTALVIASAVVCVSLIRIGPKGAFLVYVASALVAVIVSPEKTISLTYLFFFGNYPVIKALIEKQHNLKKEWFVKIGVFLIYSVIATVIAHIFWRWVTLFFPFAYPVALAFAFVTVILGGVVFDIILSFFITEIQRRLRKIL